MASLLKRRKRPADVLPSGDTLALLARLWRDWLPPHRGTLLLVAMLSSKGAAGITGAGFITLAATLSVVPSVPVAGLALILGIDRFMSECRALTNFIGNAVATIVVARWEGELDRDQLNAALSGTVAERPVLAVAEPLPAAE